MRVDARLGRHLKDLKRAHGVPPADVAVDMRRTPRFVAPILAGLVLHLAGGALRGARQMMKASRPPLKDRAALAARTRRRRAGKAGRYAGAPCARQGGGQIAESRRRPGAPHSRPLRRDAGQPRACAARSQAQRHPLAGRRIAAPHPSARPARRPAGCRPRQAGFDRLRPASGLPQSEAALHARDKLREAEDRVGPAAWPIITRIVIEGAGVRDCRGFVPELATPWRADAVVADRLRVALDRLGGLMGVTGRGPRRDDIA